MAVTKIYGIFLAITWISYATTAPDSQFYSYGWFEGDDRLGIEDDISSSVIRLTTPIVFYENSYDKVFINSNGYVTFGKKVSIPFNKLRLPLNKDVPLVAPFVADVDIRASGYIYFRETQVESILDTANNEVNTNFPKYLPFRAKSMLIVTWENVGHFENNYYEVNTFQLVLFTNGTRSFCLFNYKDDEMNWVAGDGKDGKKDEPAEAGFESSQRGRYMTLPGSGKELKDSFIKKSNVGVPGKWVFMIGNLNGGNIVGPEGSTQAAGPAVVVKEAVAKPVSQGTQTCAEGSGTCHKDARCVDYSQGYCCECVSPTNGNGKFCLEPGTPQRVSGKVEGKINNVTLDNLVMHSYVVTADGRSYAAISRIEKSVGFSMQTLGALSGIIGWIFAADGGTQLKNGFSLTGGIFNRTAIVNYDSGEQIKIHQTSTGLDQHGYVKMDTKFEGNVPPLTADSKLSVGEYTEEYKIVEPGVVRSYSTLKYVVDDTIKKSLTVDQVIRYKYCKAKPQDPTKEKITRLSVDRSFIAYTVEEGTLRFATTNKIEPASSSNPCSAGTHDCHSDADCLPSGGSYQCQCKAGFIGDGKSCRDDDECVRPSACDSHATCENTLGSYVCRCVTGYRGDGIRCEKDLTCDNIVCDRNARCIYDSERQVVRCECNEGYQGDGNTCTLIAQEQCQRLRCHREADCVVQNQRYRCECRAGFEGNGTFCKVKDTAKCGRYKCNENARCVYDGGEDSPKKCECSAGYVGTGIVCEVIPADSCSSNREICHPRAQCSYSLSEQTYLCTCQAGYKGDGYYTCTNNENIIMDNRNASNPTNASPANVPTETILTTASIPVTPTAMSPTRGFMDPPPIIGVKCNTTRCSPFAECLKDPTGELPDTCLCIANYDGNGTHCAPIPDECSLTGECGTNAKCVYDKEGRQYMCQCNQGYTGDGDKCKLETAETVVDFVRCRAHEECDENGICSYNENREQYECRCNDGFTGNGATCKSVATTKPPNSDDVVVCRAHEQCHENGQCAYNEQRQQYECKCNDGYKGNGAECKPKDGIVPCRAHEQCDQNGYCAYNEERQQYECKCNEGFKGDGATCASEQALTTRSPDVDGSVVKCSAHEQCHQNGRCAYNDQNEQYECRCNDGYKGDGATCKAEGSTTDPDPNVVPCRAHEQCDGNGRCAYNDQREQYECRCNEGFTGNGATCTPEQVVTTKAPDGDIKRCRAHQECDQNGHCAFHEQRQQYECRCNDGFTGNGASCTPEQVVTTKAPDGDVKSCRAHEECHNHALCAYNELREQYECRCNDGYTGDGTTTCTPQQALTTKAPDGDIKKCRAHEECHQNAICTYNDLREQYECRCNDGYRGNGETCTPEQAATTKVPDGDIKRCRAHEECHQNAICAYNELREQYECRCNDGYRGNGEICTSEQAATTKAPDGDIKQCRAHEECHQNAICAYNELREQYECRCNDGYRGNGETCTPEQAVTTKAPDGDIKRCRAHEECHQNARCALNELSGEYECRCNNGYTGNGVSCKLEQAVTTKAPETDITLCRAHEQCDKNGLCAFNEERQQYECRCTDGYIGNGTTCKPEQVKPVTTKAPDVDIVLCRAHEQCDEDARCGYNELREQYECRCNDGFIGNGAKCKVDDGSTPDGAIKCQDDNECHTNAKCMYNRQKQFYQCRCNAGFKGDGASCTELQCNERKICDDNAKCEYNDETKAYECKCRQGFVGDGRACTAQIIPCNRVNNCDPNADCLYEESVLGYRCRCKNGFEGNGYQCRTTVSCATERDMCDEHATCRPVGNQYVCLCNPGYRGDGRSCFSEKDLESYLLITQGMSLMQVAMLQENGRIGNQTLMVPGPIIHVSGQTSVGIDFDCQNLYFYWTDVAGHTISKARLDGTDSQNIVTGIGSPEGIAIDWLSRNMYWTDSELNRIEVSKLDGTNRKTLFDKDLVNPRAIGVDPVRGKLYWTDWNRAAPKIEMSNLDGTEREVLISDQLGLPNGLTIDHDGQEIFWADAGTQRIEAAGLDGKGRRTIYSTAAYPFGITHYGDKLYWTDWDMKTIPNINKRGGATGDPLILPLGGNGRLYGIATVKKDCPTGTNACALNNGGCRFLCLPTPDGGRTCVCPDDVDEIVCNTITLYI